MPKCPGCRFSLINETNARYGADQRILPGFENRCIALDDRYGAWWQRVI